MVMDCIGDEVSVDGAYAKALLFSFHDWSRLRYVLSIAVGNLPGHIIFGFVYNGI